MTEEFERRGLTEEEVAQYAGVSRSALRQARMDGPREGRIPTPPFVKLGRRVIYLRDDVDRWLEVHRKTFDWEGAA
jgi:predicted DNA-binding transcriptional regulator AlpA